MRKVLVIRHPKFKEFSNLPKFTEQISIQYLNPRSLIPELLDSAFNHHIAQLLAFYLSPLENKSFV